MKTVEEMLAKLVSEGLTINQAESIVCQQIVLDKISKSPLADNVLLKGGVIMFHITGNNRRTTVDLDFDVIRYDISDPSIKAFIRLLNKYDTNYSIRVIDISELKQDDYHGKRVIVDISDKTRTIKFKLDIGVHTLLAIEQQTLCFSFGEENVMLKVNPPEQIFSEKLYSLAKHGALSGRYKDIYDMFYLIKESKIDKRIVKQCLELLTMNGLHNIHSIEDICERVSFALEDKEFMSHLSTSKDKWVDEESETVVKEVLDFIYSL